MEACWMMEATCLTEAESSCRNCNTLTHFLVDSEEIAGQVMVGCGLQNEILHAFYRSCPKPEACL